MGFGRRGRYRPRAGPASSRSTAGPPGASCSSGSPGFRSARNPAAMALRGTSVASRKCPSVASTLTAATTPSSPRRAARGDRGALDALLARHVDRVHAICRRICGPDDALDATQDALIAVARSVDRFDGRAAFTTWLHRVATNAALDEVRRRRRRPEPVDIDRCAPADARRGRGQPGACRRPARPRRRARRRCPRTSGSRSCCAMSPTSTTPRSPPPSRSRSAPCGSASHEGVPRSRTALGNHEPAPTSKVIDHD